MDTPVEEARPARRGVTPPSRDRRGTAFLSDIVVELGFIDRATADWAVEHGRVVGQAVDQVLLEGGLLNDDQLSRATAEMHALEHVDLGEFEVDLEVARLVTRPAADRYGAVPIAFEDDGTLLVAVSDPVDPMALDDIAGMTKSDVHAMVAAPARIGAIIQKLHDLPPVQARVESPYGPPAPYPASLPSADILQNPDAAPAPGASAPGQTTALSQAEARDELLARLANAEREMRAIRAACERLAGHGR